MRGAVILWSSADSHPQAQVWGVPMWLRLARQLKMLNIGPIWLAGPAPAPVRVAAEKADVHAVPFNHSGTGAAPGLYLVAGASWVLDSLILVALAARAVPTVAVDRSGGALQVVGAAVVTGAQLAARASASEDAAGFFERLLHHPETTRLDLADLPTYRLQLRRHLAPFAVHVDGPARRRRACDLVLDAAQKGTNDLPAEFLHPPLENALVRVLVPLGLTPNMATAVTVLAALGVAALFAGGWFSVGVLGAVVVGVLDGVDGKIARVTVNATRSGDVFEHVADNVYEILWYLGLGSGLAATTGDPGYTHAAWAIVIVYLLDRGALGLWKLRRTGDFHESSSWDQRFRRICGRRNNIVFLMLPFFALGRPETGLVVALAWWTITFVVHAIRVGRALILGLGQPSDCFPQAP